MKKQTIFLSAFLIGLVTIASFSFRMNNISQADELIGAWKGKVQFRTGAFAEVKDLEFMYVFNSGGTMTESSNYDGAPPVPPAYGIWKKTGERKYEAKYEFYMTNLPASFEELSKAGGFTPAGYGILTEKITLSPDGKTYTSKIKLSSFDKAGKQISSNDDADVSAERIEF